MKRTFCDVCGGEIDQFAVNVGGVSFDVERLFPMRDEHSRRPRVKVTICATVEGGGAGGDLCKPCAFSAIENGDPRPQAAEVSP